MSTPCYEPWEEPQTLAEALLAECRSRSLRIDQAAELIDVDEGTGRRWERGEWKLTRLTLPALERLFERSFTATFPLDGRW